MIRSDFRLIAATNQNLDKMIGGGRFRKDLFYRLNVISIHIPPLRERKRDIIPIARHLMHNLAEEATLPQIKLAKETEALLKTYHWSGNVREISNVLERALSALDGEIIEPDHLLFYITRGGSVR
ncbi:MAG: sigma 54-interacting transcriptional regulator [Desulfobacterales bacterium]